MNHSHRIAIVSSNETPWGGSEELWQRAAVTLAGRGHSVHVYKPRLPMANRQVKALEDAGCRLSDLARPLRIPAKLFSLISAMSRYSAIALLWLRLLIGLFLFRPQIVLLSQGGNWDGAYLASTCKLLKLRYVILSQKASEFYWPPDSFRNRVRAFYADAHSALFVSDHNWRLTEHQIGCSISPAETVRNPFLVPYAAPLPWPADEEVVDFACVGRLLPMEKGQDILLQVLARETWRQRPVRVTFYGEGINASGLKDMAGFLGLENVRFAGQVSDVVGIWQRHQALVLPSRCEGLPLVVVEALLAGRVVIVTDAGGSREVLTDNVTGFLAAAATVDALDDAMERAWQRRDDWPSIADRAATDIRGFVPADPGAEVADRLLTAIADT